MLYVQALVCVIAWAQNSSSDPPQHKFKGELRVKRVSKSGLRFFTVA